MCRSVVNFLSKRVVFYFEVYTQDRFFIITSRMNYAQYMRKISATRSKIIHSPSGDDASMVTLRAQARAQTVKTPVAVETSFSQIGGTVGNILQTEQQNSSPTTAVCSSGYRGIAQGFQTVDATASVLGAAVNCAVCSDASSAEPYVVEVPCGIFLDPPANAPGKAECCVKDPGILFQGNQELVSVKAQQADLRSSFNLPRKLDGLRGPVVWYS